MSPEAVLTVFQHTLQLLLVLIMIVLIPALLVGLVVAMFQAATQINEMTLSFIPKLLVTIWVLMLAGSWMLQMLLDFTRRMFDNILLLIG
ncbi:MAG: flagellar biosynthesis protein FliQ [Chromatiales bacterium]|nr:flagellar biosynthesis protein FliQ [Gammaproteobacteria bacterium]MBW6476285.1 flagellar biosynthesis protein FliQ [Chromatiales bacterium]